MKKVFLLALFLGLFAVPAFAVEPNYAQGEIIVKFKTERARVTANFLNWQDLGKEEDLESLNASLYQIKSDKSVLNKIEELKNDPGVEYVQPNFRYQINSLGTDDTYHDYLWGLENEGQLVNDVVGTTDADIDLAGAWGINEGTNQEVIIAEIDTGVAYDHPDLASNMWDGSNCLDENGNFLGGCIHGYNYGIGTNDPWPHSSSHGTHVAGTLAAVKNNNLGVAGVAPNAKIMALQASREDGYFYDTEIAKSINFASFNGAKVINASFGGGAFNCQTIFDQLAYEAISNFDGLFVAAAGNDSSEHDGASYFATPSDFGHDTVCWQGLDNVISVAATDQFDYLAIFSDYGKNYVDVAAPGENIISTIISGAEYSYGFYQGTSMASPHVSGLAALLWGAYPEYSYQQIKEAIIYSGDLVGDLENKLVSGRRINAYSAMQYFSAPQKPEVENVVSPTSDKTQRIFGTKASNTSIWVNGEEVVAIDELTQWSAWVDLEKGQNSFTILAKNNLGTESESVSVNIELNYAYDQIGIISSPISNLYAQIKRLGHHGRKIKTISPFGGKATGAVKIIGADTNGDNKKEIVVAPGAGLGRKVKIYYSNGKYKNGLYAFDKGFNSGANIAAADVDGDNIDEIIVSPEGNFKPEVKIFKYVSKKFVLLAKASVYSNSFKNGINIAIGDINLDGKDEIIVAPKENYTPRVKVYAYRGGKLKMLAQKIVFHKSRKQGVVVKTADLNGDNKQEIIAYPRTGTSVYVGQYANGKISRLTARDVFGDYTYDGELEIEAGDTNLDGKDELVVSSKTAASPKIEIYKFLANSLDLFDTFYAYSKTFQGGVNIQVKEVDADGRDELITAPVSGKQKVKVFDVENKKEHLHSSFYPFGKSFKGGINLEN